MRGAGCTYNDLVDHDIDTEVARTRSRPLPSGRVSRFDAKTFLVVQALVGLLVLIQFNGFAILLGIASLLIVAVYPFAKRFTDWPQFFLGLAFSWGGLMGWAVVYGGLSWPALWLYLGAVAWTIGYDTIYAHQDKEDDELIGVRSTARLFGEDTKGWLVGLYGATLLFLLLSFAVAGAGVLSYLGLFVAAVMFAWQILVLDINNADQLHRVRANVAQMVLERLCYAVRLDHQHRYAKGVRPAAPVGGYVTQVVGHEQRDAEIRILVMKLQRDCDFPIAMIDGACGNTLEGSCRESEGQRQAASREDLAQHGAALVDGNGDIS
eukprot:g25230.t1